MEYYRAWVPAVAGRLSFQKIGKAHNNANAFRSYLNVDGQQRIIAWAERYTGDYRLPFLPNWRWVKESAHHLTGNIGHHTFVLSLASLHGPDTPSYRLAGKMFILQGDDFTKKMSFGAGQDVWNINVDDTKRLFSLFGRQLEYQDISLAKLLMLHAKYTEQIGQVLYGDVHSEPYRFCAISDTISAEIKQIIASSQKEIETIAERVSHASIEVELQKNGLCLFTVKDADALKAKSYFNLDVSLGSDAAQQSLRARQEEVHRHRLVDQFFYALRDFSHAHHHHDPANDNYSYTYRVSSEADGSWAWKALSDFHRRLLALRRRDHNHRYHAPGFASYGVSLEKILKQSYPDKMKEIKPKYLRGNQLKSMESEISSMHSLREMRVWGKQIKLSVITLIMAPILAIMISLMTVSVSISPENKTLSPMDVFYGVIYSKVIWAYFIVFLAVYIGIDVRDRIAWFNRNLYILNDIIATKFNKKIYMQIASLFLAGVMSYLFLLFISLV
jgi:hypothetical protein